MAGHFPSSSMSRSAARGATAARNTKVCGHLPNEIYVCYMHGNNFEPKLYLTRMKKAVGVMKFKIFYMFLNELIFSN